jgi:hypothetical protein
MTVQVPVVQVPVVQVLLGQVQVDRALGDHFVIVMTDQVPAVPVEMMIDLRAVVMIVPPVVGMTVQVPVVQVPVVQVLLGQVQVDRALDDHFVIVMTDQVPAVPVETMIDLRAVVMTDRVRVVQVRVDQVPVAQVQVDHFVVVMIVGMIGQVAIAMIAVMFQPVLKRQPNARPTKYITAPVVASTAKSRCHSQNTPLSNGATTALLMTDRVGLIPVTRVVRDVRRHAHWPTWKPQLPRQLRQPWVQTTQSGQ